MDVKTFLLVLALTASPIFALTIEPSTFSAVLYPGENVTFSFNVTGSDMIYTSTGENLSCAFGDGQKIKFVSGTTTDNLTITVNKDAGIGTYRCDITAQTTVPDPSTSSQGTSGGGSGLYIPSDLQQKLLNGSYIAVPKDIILPYNGTTEKIVFVKEPSILTVSPSYIPPIITEVNKTANNYSFVSNGNPILFIVMTVLVGIVLMWAGNKIIIGDDKDVRNNT